MSSLVRGVGFRWSTMGLVLVIWGFAGGSAGAQTTTPTYGTTYGYGAGVPTYYGPPPGVFGPGYHGFGLDYGCDGRCLPRYRNPQEPTPGSWVGYVLGKENLYPYVADPYCDPKAALGFWPPYSAPVAGSVYAYGAPSR